MKKKTKLVGFQTDEDMHRRVVETARQKGFDTYADWMRNVVSDEIDAHDTQPRSYDPAIITKLATVYASYLAPKLSHAMQQAETDQPELLHRVLVALTEHMARGCDAADLVIVPRSEWHPQPFQQLHAAEDKAPYKSGAAPTPQRRTARATPVIPSAG